jgi:hypothetical protein
MRADGVVGVFPLAELGVEGRNRPGARGHLVELLGMRALGAFHRAVELGTAGRPREQRDAPLLTGGLEAGLKLGAPVHLHGPERKGQPGLHGCPKTESQGLPWPAYGPRAHPTAK